MLILVREHDAGQGLLEQDAEERARRGATFRQVASAYLTWLERVKGAKPSTLRDHRSVLGEPGQRHRRGTGVSSGRIMAALGDRPAREITTLEIERLLAVIAASGVAPTTVNRARAVMYSAFNFAMRPSAFGLPANPVTHADRRAEPPTAAPAFYSSEQIELLARALASGTHRETSKRDLGGEEVVARPQEDAQDGELIRVAAYAGLRRGELVALHWRDVDFIGRKLTRQIRNQGAFHVASLAAGSGSP